MENNGAVCRVRCKPAAVSTALTVQTSEPPAVHDFYSGEKNKKKKKGQSFVVCLFLCRKKKTKIYDVPENAHAKSVR